MQKKLKLREECKTCIHFEGDSVEDCICKMRQNPTCYRRKLKCKKHSLRPELEIKIPEKKEEPKREEQDTANKIDKMIAYTDGSYNQDVEKYGYGVVLIVGEEKFEYKGAGKDIHGGWQVEGEIQAVLFACTKALELGCKELEIRYDYMGISNWALGLWKTKKSYTRLYAKRMREFSEKMKITFTHVKAHTGEDGNERVDILAKMACGLLREEASKSQAVVETATPKVRGKEAVAGLNPQCRKAINTFYQTKSHRFRDYIALKTYGVDQYSKLSKKSLYEYAKQNDLLDKMPSDFDDTMRESCIRWKMRGLLIEDAIRKAQVDREIKNNCGKSDRGW